MSGTHVVLHIGVAAREEENPGGLVVAGLAAEVEDSEGFILRVYVGLGLAEAAHRLSEALPGGLV